MKISISIMAHPDRAYLIDSLYKKLLPIESKVVWDEKNNIWDTCRRAWLTHDAQSDYHLVIQDDALIGKLFHFRLMKLLEPGLDVIYSLYLGNRKRFHEAVKPIIRAGGRSEEHTSELQSRPHLVCRLLLEKKKTKNQKYIYLL